MTKSSFEDLKGLIHTLRSPGGCPWDREQTHTSLKPMLLEEAYEVIEAIDEGDDQELIGELGDLLIQVIFHSEIASETGRFSIEDVIDRVHKKMVRRHPHVFGDEKAEDSAEVLKNWEAIKAAEKRAAGVEKRSSMLDSVSKAMPSLMEAFQLTTRAARVHFDWPSPEECLEKLSEEFQELKTEIAATEPNEQAIAEEVGDLLFVAVNIARLLKVDPESALKQANRKFRRRFAHIEESLAAKGKSPEESTLNEMESYWQEAKKLEKQATQ
ncbi:MAG: nucleoside triphosphate pyrophosphohydrolase [Blastocatellia bacterium]|nr:nucleoside triphosphate pyrophosphohydrolase [Blastocatellia bacterium]